MAAKYYSKAAAQGNAEGAYNLGLLYQNGKGVKQDFKMAMHFIEKAARSQPKDNKGIPVLGVAEA